ncbi:MAG: hypothetical protein HY763_01360 [Planctomycetes bacterium]|nr:hypothetical protein [Planctomycetota bacterium]
MAMREVDYAGATAFLAGRRRPLLLTHVKPDGDALGSLTAMRLLLTARGTAPVALLFEELPSRYSIFRKFGPLPVLGTDLGESDLSAADAVVVLDTCSYSQLTPVADWLRRVPLSKLAVDHHATRDELAECALIDIHAAANCLILHEWAQASGWSVGVPTAEALFIGLAMDTGWFRHSNTDARALAAAAELVTGGVCPSTLYEHLYLRDPASRVKLLGVALASLEILAAGRLAVMTLPARVFDEVGASMGDTEDLINEPLRIAGVDVSVLFVEQKDGVVRVSFRSKPPTAGRPDVDVSGVAQAFGGGGHARAAGARPAGSLAEVRREVLQRIGDALRAV